VIIASTNRKMAVMTNASLRRVPLVPIFPPFVPATVSLTPARLPNVPWPSSAGTVPI